jgi:hypothetical protein
MERFRTSTLLAELSHITEANLEFTHANIFNLSDKQLNWKKDSFSWSILETLCHLNEYANYYHEVIARRIAKTRFREPSAFFTSSPLGRATWSSMKLGNARNIKRKLRSPKMYNPLINKDILNDNAIDSFLKQHLFLIHLLEQAAHVNLRKVRIPTFISPLIRLRLGDVFMFIVYHNERHLQQIRNTLAHSQFPTNPN